MLAALQKHWFLTSLAAIITVGMWLGANGYSGEVRPVVSLLNPQYLTMVVTFLMAFSLDSHRLGQSFRSPGPVLLGCVLNYGLLPLLAWGLSRFQLHTDFRVGLMIAGSVPCTLVAASVMTRKGGGNDAVSLLTTVATNVSCFALTPFWLWLALDQRVEMDFQVLMRNLLVAVLIPTILGQLVRQPAKLLALAKQYKTPIGVVGQVIIEMLVFTAALRAGESWSESQALAVHQEVAIQQQIEGLPAERGTSVAGNEAVVPSGNARHFPISLTALLVVWLSSLAIHGIGLSSGYFGSRGLGFSRMDAIAVTFAGSQKTLPVGLYLATTETIFGKEFPFALLPMLLYHTTQLFLDTMIAGRLARVKDDVDPRAPAQG